MTSPTFSQIRAQVSAVRQKVPRARVIGIQSPNPWAGEAVHQDGDQTLVIRQCDSPLAMRLALREMPGDGSIGVLVTALNEEELGDDVLLRLAKRKLFPLAAWPIVRSHFEAHAVDPRLMRHGWIAQTLLELVPGSKCPAARGGFLDAETVWSLLLERLIGFQAESPDLTSLLRWSLDLEAVTRLRQCRKEIREGVICWLIDQTGPVAELVLRTTATLNRPDTVPIGLAAGVIFHPSVAGKLERAAGKLEERFLGGRSPAPDAMRRWGAAATEVLRSLNHDDAKLYRQLVQRTDEILAELQAEAMAYLSDTSPLGFDQRLEEFGEQLLRVLAFDATAPAPLALDELYAAREAVRRHDHAHHETQRLERVDMALRLVRWLHSDREIDKRSLAAAAEDHLRDGGFVDWARHSLQSGDPVSKLSQAYARLFDRVTEVRQQQSKVFANLLVDWTAAGSQGEEIIPVERILEMVVAPLAAEGMVLVIVLDGMSVAVCRELLADITRHEWMAISEPGRSFNRPGLAAIPCMTEFSRTSLLCGELRHGGQDNERSGFAGHPALVACSRAGSPPILFHKAGLQGVDDSVLANEVRKEIVSTHRRVVAVVVNAVDDDLAKGEQLETRWTRDKIKVLPALLHEARIARRLVVLLSDHGHVLERRGEYRVHRDVAGGERWRPSQSGEPAPDECEVIGTRVLTDGHRLIAPWSEHVRYGTKKNGYHGGLSPQEMVVPISVLSSTDKLPSGWSDQPIETPAWWDNTPTSPPIELPPPKLKPPVVQPSETLFDLTGEDEPTADLSESDGPALPAWIARLLACPLFADQKRLGGRGVPADEVFSKLLLTLETRGGKMTTPALARALEFPPIRLPGMLAKVQRVLNVDGYEVLGRDDASQTVELNRDLLLKQFDLVE